MADIRFLADMNISPKTVKDLRAQGWDIVRVSQVLLVDAPDWEVLDFARKEGRVIVTQDLDFSTLLVLGGYENPSLITLRLAVSDPETITTVLLRSLASIRQAITEGSAVTIEDAAIRIRRLPIG
jgi:predicted nuclease of predicted toxin-antitoxin system